MDLNDSICYVVYCYPDNSHKYFRSSLNPEILDTYEGYVKSGYLFDIDRKRFVKLPIPDSGIQLEIIDEIENSKEVTELDVFFHRFI